MPLVFSPMGCLFVSWCFSSSNDRIAHLCGSATASFDKRVVSTVDVLMRYAMSFLHFDYIWFTQTTIHIPQYYCNGNICACAQWLHSRLHT
eukprot:1055660-Amphidinium_carterae.1